MKIYKHKKNHKLYLMIEKDDGTYVAEDYFTQERRSAASRKNKDGSVSFRDYMPIKALKI